MKKNTLLDKKISELEKAVLSLRNNRDSLLKELEDVRARTGNKQTALR